MATDFNAILDQILAAQDKANAANLTRYNQLLGSINTLGTQVGEAGTYGKALALQEQVGTAGRQRITEQAMKTFATAEQDLTTRGLGNTTIREAVKRGTAHDAEMARQQLEESVAMQKSGIYQGLAGAQLQIGGMRAGAVEGRTDQGPDLGMFASLLSAAAAGDKADAAQVRTSRVLSARTAASGPGTGWGGSGGGASGGLSPQGGGAALTSRPSTPSGRIGTGGPPTSALQTNLRLAMGGGGGISPVGGAPSTPALAGAAGPQELTGQQIGEEARAAEEAIGDTGLASLGGAAEAAAGGGERMITCRHRRSGAIETRPASEWKRRGLGSPGFNWRAVKGDQSGGGGGGW